MMTKMEDLLRLVADSEECCNFDDKLTQIIEEECGGYLEEEFLENVAGGSKKKDKDGQKREK